MKKVFAYGRASTDRQQLTLESQKEICESWFKLKIAMGEELELAGWFPDAAVTSRLPWPQRPMGERIFRAAEKDDIVLVSNFDRAFRSVTDCDNTIRVCNEKGIALVILDVDVDTHSPLGRAFMKIIAVIKELEREEISRRTREALSLKYRAGKPVTAESPIGWTKKGFKRESEYVPNPVERKIAREIVHLRDTKRLPFREIEKVFAKRNVKTGRNGQWFLRRICKAYVAAKCGFPKVFMKDLPYTKDLKIYMAEHGGRPPQLQHRAFSSGILHTLPPLPDPVLVQLQQDVV